MSGRQDLKALVAYESYRCREFMSPERKQLLNREFPRIRDALIELYERYGKKMRPKLDWSEYNEDRDILRRFRDREPIQKDDRYALRRLLLKQGERVPNNVELADYPQYTKEEPRERTEEILERLQHRPFGRRSVFWHHIKDWIPGKGTQRYRIKGHFQEIIDLLKRALTGSSEEVSYTITPRLASGFRQIWLQIREEKTTIEEREKKERMNLEVARGLASLIH